MQEVAGSIPVDSTKRSWGRSSVGRARLSHGRCRRFDPSRLHSWGCSSVGRALALQAGCRPFDPGQLHEVCRRRSSDGRALPWYGRGRAFDSRRRLGKVCGRSSDGRARASQARCRRFNSGRPLSVTNADVAQLVEPLFCKQAVGGSSPFVGSGGVRCGSRGSSSVGRASAFQAERRRFESGLPLEVRSECERSSAGRALLCQGRGRRFESGRSLREVR